MFGDLLRRISAIRGREKAAEFAIAKVDLPAMWIAANMEALKRAMASAAEDGKRSLDFDARSVRIGSTFHTFEAVNANGTWMGLHPFDDLSDSLYVALKKALRAEGIKLTRETRETRYQRKPLVYVQWVIKW